MLIFTLETIVNQLWRKMTKTKHIIGDWKELWKQQIMLSSQISVNSFRLHNCFSL